MSEMEKDVHASHGYEEAKSEYDVGEYYDTPRWYKRCFVWLWPTICLWLFITIAAAPEYKAISSLGFGAAVIGFQICAWLMDRAWPIEREK
ncbi:MAG: hypothetical protein IKN76_01435 [Oscillospiraceae bacterium]|nr:hypothetical protein [Oscillospiraceae bacterium]